MKGEGIILRVICPYCQKKELTMFESREEKLANALINWKCPDCVYMFPKSWFNTFNQHEKFVLRQGEDKMEWLTRFVDIPRSTKNEVRR